MYLFVLTIVDRKSGGLVKGKRQPGRNGQDETGVAPSASVFVRRCGDQPGRGDWRQGETDDPAARTKGQGRTGQAGGKGLARKGRSRFQTEAPFAGERSGEAPHPVEPGELREEPPGGTAGAVAERTGQIESGTGKGVQRGEPERRGLGVHQAKVRQTGAGERPAAAGPGAVADDVRPEHADQVAGNGPGAGPGGQGADGPEDGAGGSARHPGRQRQADGRDEGVTGKTRNVPGRSVPVGDQAGKVPGRDKQHQGGIRTEPVERDANTGGAGKGTGGAGEDQRGPGAVAEHAGQSATATGKTADGVGRRAKGNGPGAGHVEQGHERTQKGNAK